MNLEPFGLASATRKTLVVLGAGASRGASYVTDNTAVLPPLDRDFFQQLTRMPQTTQSSRLLRFVRAEYGHELGLSMEQFFSEADYTNRFHVELNVDRGPKVKKYERALRDFMTALPLLLERTTSQACDFHAALANALHSQDCIISFNYDCLIDRALRDFAGPRWDPSRGSYGFDVAAGADHWKRDSRGRPPEQPMRLLKMHGSSNWIPVNHAVELAASTADVSDLSDAIIPPTWFKDLQKYPFGEIWKQARKEIRTARAVIVIGYSVPDTDLFSRSLFKVEAGSKEKREQLDLVVLVNPHPESRRRFLDLISRGVEPNTRILEYESFAELHRVLTREQAIEGPA